MRIVILGAGESGVGSAILAQAKGFDVFVSDMSAIKPKYKEELEMLILKARYQEANQSVDEKKADRFRVVIDEYYSFINNYPDSPNREEADNIFKIASKYITD
jgi:3-hydroxyacyl-CoA dehydrogenase